MISLKTKNKSKHIFALLSLAIISQIALAKKETLESSNNFCKFVDSKFYNIERMMPFTTEFIIPET